MNIKRSTTSAILLGGLIAGALDITSAFASYVPHGASEAGILCFIASGLIGKAALSGGTTMALLGLVVHFGLTTIMAAVFVFAARRCGMLLAQPWFAGIAYGISVFVVMNYVVVPFSAVASWTPTTGWALAGAVLAHCFYVGVPIAFVARHFLGAASATRA